MELQQINQQQPEKLSDDDFLIEFDNLVSKALSRINYENLGPSNKLNQFNSTSSVSSNSSISSINIDNHRPNRISPRIKNARLYEISKREISLNSNSFYTGSKFKPVLTKADKENLHISYIEHEKRANIEKPLKRSNVNASNQPKIDDTELDISEVYHFSDTDNCLHGSNNNMCSSMIQDPENRHNNSNQSFQSIKKKKQRITPASKSKKLKVSSGRDSLNIGFLPSLLNELILILVKYLNKTVQANLKLGRKNSHSSKIDTKCVKLMNKKVKIATFYNYITQMIFANKSKKSIESSILLSILAETVSNSNSSSESSPMHSKASSKKSSKVKNNIYSSSISSMSTGSLLTTSDSSINMEIDLADQNDLQTKSVEPVIQSESDTNEQKWQNQLEIPNIEDPLLFIDTLYNQLLANNNADIKEQETNTNVNSINSSSNTSSSSSLNNSCLDMQFESASKEKTEDVPDSTLNEDQMSSCLSVNNDLSLIDYSYLIANHGSEKHDQAVKEIDQGVQEYVKMIPNLVDWNYEDETSDFNDLSINYDDFIRNKLPERKLCQSSIEESEPLITSTQKIFDKGKLLVGESTKSPPLIPKIFTSLVPVTEINLSKSIQFPVGFPLSPSISSPSTTNSSSISKSISPFNFSNKFLRSNIKNFYSCIDLNSSINCLPSTTTTYEFAKTQQKDIKPEINVLETEGLLMPCINEKIDNQSFTIVKLIPERSNGYMQTLLNSVFSSFKYLMMSRNIVLLPIFLILLNSRFKTVSNISGGSVLFQNGLSRMSTSAALISLSSIIKSKI